MNRIKLVLGMLAAGAVCSVSAQLQFTNLTLSTSPNLFHGLTNQLNSVVFGGNSNFLAVGANQIYVYGNFQPGQTWITNSGWVTNQILPANKLNLASVTLGNNNTFVTTGTSNVVFSAANNFSSAGLSWSRQHNIFSSTVFSPAIAYNGNGYAAVAEIPQISWSGITLPTSTTWVPGTLANIDFAESFRGVTAYGANGFAACGLYADVRLSANGTNWPAAVSGHIGLPDLYSIAWDGAQTLVAVGATNSSSSDNGVIMASSNSGNTTWKTVYVNGTANTPLNAVTYTGSGFIAVGNKGLILTSPDGVTWTLVTNTLSNVNFNGVAYANTGPLIGVSELVGDSGAVVLAGTPPPSPVNPINETNCSSYPNAPVYSPLSVTLVTDANHPAGTVTVDWYDARTNVVGAGTTSFFPTNNPDLRGANAVSNIIFYAVERDLRTGFNSTNRLALTLQLIPRPSATLPVLTTNICNEGDSFTLTNTLTGIGPWTVIWNDDVTQTVAQAGPGPVTLTRTVSPTDPFANAASNNVYFVTIVTNADMCQGNLPGDISGTASITVNPRPTATLASLDTTNCNDGSSYTLTNTLTGLGPWNVLWNDNTIQVALGNSGPVVLTRTIFPTNSVGANAASNNVYYVKSVSNGDTCSGNQPGDIMGTNHIVINPRPTAKLLTVAVTNCDLGASYTLTNTLTGIGPWTVLWNDGTVQTTNGAGPLVLTRSVTPTTSSANAASNNVYFVTMVTNDVDTCIGNQAGDITGTAQFLINPLPTVTLTITTNDFGLSTNGVATGLLESISQPSSTSYGLIVGFQALQNGSPYTISNQTLSVTNHLTFTGIGPWAVVLSDGHTALATNYSANATYVWNEVVSTNANASFTFSVTSVSDTNTGCSGSETNIYAVSVFDAPTAAVVDSTNTTCGSGSDSVTISATLGGFGPWTNVVWSDGFTNDLVTSSPFTRDVTATNNSLVPIGTSYSIVSLTDSYGTTTTSANNFSGVADLIVDPYPTNPPTAIVATNYTCPEVAVMLAVTVPPNFTADWYADPGLTTSLAMNTTNYLASITDEPATNIYYVTMRYNDAFSLTNCGPAVPANIYLIATPCTNEVSSITSTNGNVIISWNGNYVLQGTTNLVPPTIWFNLSTGQLGPNYLTNNILNGPPYEFFRLYAPTN
ncbi:MAG TPA: hypothetical protein VMH87_11815 [Pseudomonadales bacterium]|nr:hypothetical protein [Pseudomonadales bacterium]